MEKHTAIVIDWYGPWPWDGSKWSLGEPDSGRSQFGRPGIYLAIQRKKQKWSQYVGIAKTNVYNRVHEPVKKHHKLKKIVGPFELWIGEVSNAPKSQSFLGVAEWAHAFGLQPRPIWNVQKKRTPPHHRVTVINLWWKDDHEQSKPPHKNWPNRIDLIYTGTDHLTLECWLGHRIRRFDCVRRNGNWEVKVKA